jgi:predicted secreted Zn-dependent protease
MDAASSLEDAAKRKSVGRATAFRRAAGYSPANAHVNESLSLKRSSKRVDRLWLSCAEGTLKLIRTIPASSITDPPAIEEKLEPSVASDIKRAWGMDDEFWKLNPTLFEGR